jgi:two-component system NtrC family response regulator
MRVEVPPLRERLGDAVMLAKFFLGRFNKQYNKSLRGFAADALSAIAAYSWPGNVRQLENNVRKAVVMADGRTVTAADLGLSEVADRQAPTPTLQEVRKEAERKLVNDVLATTQGNISKTAKILGVSRPTLYMMMRNLGLRAEE